MQINRSEKKVKKLCKGLKRSQRRLKGRQTIQKARIKCVERKLGNLYTKGIKLKKKSKRSRKRKKEIKEKEQNVQEK